MAFAFLKQRPIFALAFNEKQPEASLAQLVEQLTCNQ